MWLGGEDQETWLCYNGPSYKCEGQVRVFGATDHVAVMIEQGLVANGLLGEDDPDSAPPGTQPPL